MQGQLQRYLVAEVRVIKFYQIQELPYLVTADCKDWEWGDLLVVEGPKMGQRAQRGRAVDSLALLIVKKVVSWHPNPFRHSL